MGEAARLELIPDAASGFAADPDAARSALSAFWADERGATSIEYAMIAGGLSIVVITAVDLLGGNVKSMLFDKLAAVTK